LLVSIETTVDIDPVVRSIESMMNIDIIFEITELVITMDVKATVIDNMIVTDLNALVTAVGTTSLHETVITTAADPAAGQWIHVGHSVLISVVTLHTAGLAVPSAVATGTMTVILAVDLTDQAEIPEINAAEPALSTLPPGVYVSVTKVSIVVDQIVVIQVNNQAGSERLLHRLAAIHRQS
jgi:hypothetical protein